MGKSKDAIFGGFSGRLGNIVGCYRYGKYYLRTLPEKVNQPDTPAQLAQRMRFRLVQEFLSPFKGLLKIGFAAYASGRSAYSAAVSYNLRHAISGEYPDLAIDPEKVLLSRGKLPTAQSASVAFAHQKLLFTWTVAKEENGDDNAVAIVFCPGFGEAVWQIGTARRGDTEALVALPQTWKNRQMMGFLCFCDNRILSHSVKADYISDSQYAGSVIAGSENIPDLP
jgi:hypothetical protein